MGKKKEENNRVLKLFLEPRRKERKNFGAYHEQNYFLKDKNFFVIKFSEIYYELNWYSTDFPLIFLSVFMLQCLILVKNFREFAKNTPPISNN